LEKLVSKIDKANDKIYIEIYMFTENKRLPEALVRAKRRGIDVKVLLEKNPYKTSNINNKIFKYLQKNNIDVRWSNSENYSLNHSKIMIIDDEVIIST
jgi:phosphatidylserine/phosphatidylglycerophosphate/cardiolipin synthase-like enzyme